MTRYTPEPVDKSSSVSGTDSTQGDKSDSEVAGKDGDLAKTIKDIEKENKPIDKPKYSDGISMEDGERLARQEERPLENMRDAWKNAHDTTRTTNILTVPVKRGDGFVLYPAYSLN